MENVRNRIYVYGLNSENNVTHYAYIDLSKQNCGVVNSLRTLATWIKIQYPGTQRVYAADNSIDVYEACTKSMKRGWTEDKVIFKVLLEQVGMRLL